MSTTDTKILVVDDEETLCEVVQLNLENEGYTVDIANCAEQALEMDLAQYSLILLDIMMGEISGIKMAKMLKNDPKTANIPIIFCSAKDTDDDVVLGLNLGADDYITKPYTIRQLIARVKSVLRRTTATTQTPTLSFEGLALDVEFKQCIIDGNEVKLPRKEYELLLLFLSHKGRIFSREEILQKVWPDEVVVLDRTIDVNITRLRQKLGEYGKYIVTRSGYGYGFKA
ncbi:MAG: response regulator transcription factor [Paludibacteraceae bacterium]|nr:response regulator transcription factor [Paludibacteraceae bacterium]